MSSTDHGTQSSDAGAGEHALSPSDFLRRVAEAVENDVLPQIDAVAARVRLHALVGTVRNVASELDGALDGLYDKSNSALDEVVTREAAKQVAGDCRAKLIALDWVAVSEGS